MAVQVMRDAFMVVVSPPGSGLWASSARIAIWSVASGALFIVGATLPTAGQVAVWIAPWSRITPARTRATGSP